MDRRQLLGATMAAAIGMAAPTARADASAAGDAALASLLRACAESLLIHAPEDATGLDFDVGAHADLRARLEDRSPEAKAAARVRSEETLARLRRIDAGALSAGGARDLAAAVFVYQTFADLLGRYGEIDLNLRPSPYVVNQMNGAYYWLPDVIGSRQPLETRADVEAWYGRLTALGAAIDQETRRIGEDARLGVVPPGFVIDRAVAQIAQLRDGDPLASALLAPAIQRAAKAGLGDLGPRGADLFRETVAPALSRQIAALAALRPGAVETPGIWRLPDGEAYYAAALRANTTVDTGPGALHEAGVAQARDLLGQIDRGLRAQGMTTGTVGARLGALNRDPRFLVSNDDAGRARLIEAGQRALTLVTGRLPRAFNDPPNDPVVVRRMAIAIEASSPSAFYEEGAPGQPGVFRLNLARPADYPLWRLPTLAHHEGIPGHHFQFDVLRRQGALPLFSRALRFSAYVEGWALYAEQLADEMGVYEDDPFGRIGYLQSELFRAARIVVDTGLHHRRWSRDQAVAWMVEEIGETPDATRREIDRYCVYPGQACSFKVGANAIVAAREAARRRLGPRFDIRAFHDLVLKSGLMPMEVLAAAAGRWTGEAEGSDG